MTKKGKRFLSFYQDFLLLYDVTISTKHTETPYIVERERGFIVTLEPYFVVVVVSKRMDELDGVGVDGKFRGLCSLNEGSCVSFIMCMCIP